MRYYEARQRLDGFWAWTYLHDDMIYTTFPCDGEYPCEHRKKEDAERHFYFEEIKRASERPGDPSVLRKCEYPDCAQYTHMGLMTPTLFSLSIFLCDKHRSANGLMESKPFLPGMQIWKS